MRILDRQEIGTILDTAPPRYRTAIAVSIFSGVRQGELLGLRWSDLDVSVGLLRVSKQLDRAGGLVEPKTAQAFREIVLPPFLVRILKEHRLGSPFCSQTDFVFASATGGPLHYRNLVRRGLEKATELGNLDGEGRPKLRWHDLRHTAASLWIAEGLDVVFVAQQLGHSSPDVTLKVYAHAFDREAHADRASAALEAAFDSVL